MNSFNFLFHLLLAFSLNSQKLKIYITQNWVDIIRKKTCLDSRIKGIKVAYEIPENLLHNPKDKIDCFKISEIYEKFSKSDGIVMRSETRYNERLLTSHEIEVLNSWYSFSFFR